MAIIAIIAHIKLISKQNLVSFLEDLILHSISALLLKLILQVTYSPADWFALLVFAFCDGE